MVLTTITAVSLGDTYSCRSQSVIMSRLHEIVIAPDLIDRGEEQNLQTEGSKGRLAASMYGT